MKSLWIAFGAVVVLMLILGGCYFSGRNALIAQDENVNEHWSQIEVQLQRRADLIPNLVSSVKGFAKHEEKIFTELASARAHLLSAKGPSEKAAAGAELNGALGRLLAISENYPDLKSNQNFIRLQDELAGTENRISVARGRYNSSVREFNRAIRSFPGSMFAGELDLKPREYFEAPQGRAAVEKAPEVKF